ncbi:MAG: hypothetical protein WD738_08605 [Pirellulales bacterium]
MSPRLKLLLIVGSLVASGLPSLFGAAHEFAFDCGPNPSGKVCKLVCETKKLTGICYACECDEICIPGHSRPGCKHCATCDGELICGECEPSCPDCEAHTPQCKFCWYDWFACGCAKPRTVKVLTKYQAEKEISWYHWEVVDAACCECVADSGAAAPDRCVYKPAPPDAELGDIVAVSDDEWAELASILRPEEKQAAQSDELLASKPDEQSSEESTIPTAEPERISIAERLGRLFWK